ESGTGGDHVEGRRDGRHVRRLREPLLDGGGELVLGRGGHVCIACQNAHTTKPHGTSSAPHTATRSSGVGGPEMMGRSSRITTPPSPRGPGARRCGGANAPTAHAPNGAHERPGT